MHTPDEINRALKAISDRTRLQIVQMLGEQELCACDLLEVFDITQPTLSYHMRILMQAGIVSGKKEGVWMRYSLVPETMVALTRFFSALSPDNSQNG